MATDVMPETPAIEVLYTNWRGETRWRTIHPVALWWGRTAWHPERQWLMTAFDPDKVAFRDFAVKQIQRWGKDGPALPTRNCPFCEADPATWGCHGCGNEYDESDHDGEHLRDH